ncbi:MAG: hypothetical protein HWE39_01270 [Oceanospirillaceae bacterium]|nr:hypothetical protein [Oceanospirillaceae bacterium]
MSDIVQPPNLSGYPLEPPQDPGPRDTAQKPPKLQLKRNNEIPDLLSKGNKSTRHALTADHNHRKIIHLNLWLDTCVILFIEIQIAKKPGGHGHDRHQPGQGSFCRQEDSNSR